MYVSNFIRICVKDTCTDWVGTLIAECFELAKTHTSVTANCARPPQICNSLQHLDLIEYVWGISGSWYLHGFPKVSGMREVLVSRHRHSRENSTRARAIVCCLCTTHGYTPPPRLLYLVDAIWSGLTRENSMAFETVGGANGNSPHSYKRHIPMKHYIDQRYQ